MSPRMMMAALTLLAATAPALAQTQAQDDKAAAAAPKAVSNFAPSAAIPQPNAPQASARTSSTARATESEQGAVAAPRAANEMK